MKAGYDVCSISQSCPKGDHVKLRTTILSSGKTTTGFEVPEAIVSSLGTSRRPAVRVTINDYTYRTSVASMGGVFMVSVSAEVRERAGVAAGDEVEVDIELDTDPREVVVPADLRDALELDADATRNFDRLSYSNKRRIVLSVEQAKTTETRQRRIAKAVSTLREDRI
jgi:bifunctional DNA-binding transcriptional regulator/antitoxin component of YhaV-PrlF toxin-antitoxin module